MFWRRAILCSLGFLLPVGAEPRFERVECLKEALTEHQKAMLDSRGLPDIEQVQTQLRAMARIDQLARKSYELSQELDAEELAEFKRQITPLILRVDQENLAQIKQMLIQTSWFKRSLFGDQADQDAWLLVQHADSDPELQKAVLQRLEPLVTQGETRPSNYAYLFDRVAASWHQPEKRTLQRYGTQGRPGPDGRWQPFPVEDPDNLDRRRAEMGLGPETEYIQMMNRK